MDSLALAVLALAAAAGTAVAGAPKILGWTSTGIAVARLPDSCAECDGPRPDVLHAADGTGVDETFVDLPALVKPLLAGRAATKPTLDGEPVELDLREVHRTADTAADDGALVVTAKRRGKRVAVTTVMTYSVELVDRLRIVAMSASPDGHRLAVAIDYVSGVGDRRGEKSSLVVLGPGPAALPDAAAARDDLVAVRHGRTVAYARVEGWTADDDAVVMDAREAHAPGQVYWSRSLWLDDGTHRAILSDLEATWRPDTKPAARIDHAAARAMIASERFGLALLPPLRPSRAARPPAIRATGDRARGTITLRAGAKLLATRDLRGFIPDDVRVRSVAVSPDGHRAAVTIAYTSTDRYGPNQPPPTRAVLVVVVTL